MSSAPAPPDHTPVSADKVIPYSFMVNYKEPIPTGFQAEFLAKIKTMCSQHSTAPTGEKLPGVTVEFNEIFKGFGGQFHPDVVAEMRKEERVEVIQDGLLEIFNFGPYVDQDTTSWALAEISKDLTMPFDPKPPQKFKYHRSSLAGEGITIWILDGGCNNVVNELDASRVAQEPWDSGAVIVHNTTDELVDLFSKGKVHGTNVAATAAGLTLGAAPKAKVRAIRLADPVGMLPTALHVSGALEYIVTEEKDPHLCVINCSWGVLSSKGFTRASIKRSIDAVVSKGFTFVAAAGNGEKKMVGGVEKMVGIEIQATTKNEISDSTNPKILFPASQNNVITVGALNKDHKPAEWSNFGTPVDIWAPGTEIPSVGSFSAGVTQGTSFAAPLVSGVIACILAEKARDEPGHKMTTQEVKTQLLDWGVKFSGNPTLLHNGRPLL